jgi:hypothetical protein
MWAELLKASLVGAVAFLAVSKLKAFPLTSAHFTFLPKYAATSAGVIAAVAIFAARRSLGKRPSDRGKGKFRIYPALRGCDDAAAGFTAASIQTRLPRIIDDIIATIPELHQGVIDELRALRLEISSDGVISGLPAERAANSPHSSGAALVDVDDEPDWPSYSSSARRCRCRSLTLAAGIFLSRLWDSVLGYPRAGLFVKRTFIAKFAPS